MTSCWLIFALVASANAFVVKSVPNSLAIGTQQGHLKSVGIVIRCQADPMEPDTEEVNEATAAPPAPPVCSYPGCDGNGRVLGGLAAWGPTSWWPIKAYRPCPTCAAQGRRYVRSGQTLDEIVFKKNPQGGYYGDD